MLSLLSTIAAVPLSKLTDRIVRKSPSVSISFAKTSTVIGVSSFVVATSLTTVGASFNGITEIFTLAVLVNPVPLII